VVSDASTWPLLGHSLLRLLVPGCNVSQLALDRQADQRQLQAGFQADTPLARRGHLRRRGHRAPKAEADVGGITAKKKSRPKAASWKIDPDGCPVNSF